MLVPWPCPQEPRLGVCGVLGPFIITPQVSGVLGPELLYSETDQGRQASLGAPGICRPVLFSSVVRTEGGIPTPREREERCISLRHTECQCVSWFRRSLPVLSSWVESPFLDDLGLSCHSGANAEGVVRCLRARTSVNHLCVPRSAVKCLGIVGAQ